MLIFLIGWRRIMMVKKTTLLTVNNVSKSVQPTGKEKRLVLNEINLRLYDNEVVSILGQSGSGKSTLLRMLSGLIAPDLGTVMLGDKKVSGPNPQINMVFQTFAIFPWLNVYQNIAFGLQAQDLPPQVVEAQTLKMLDLVGLAPYRDAYPRELSGGMRQRVMIAMALSCKPALLIADEPTTALDVTIQAQILQLIRVLQREMQMGVIFITHDMGVVAEIADRVLVMRRGEQVEQNRVRELFAAPQQAYTRALLAAVPKLGAMADRPLPAKFPLPGGEGDTAPQDTVPPDAAPILQVEHLVTRFDLRGGLFNRVTRRVHAVENVSFDLYPGETLGLVGESGCGKSTTGRSLLKLVDSQSGTITFAGRRIDQLKGPALQHLRRDIQFIFQDPYASLDPRLTVGFSIMEPLLVHNVMRGREAEQRVAWLLERVGLLPEHARRYPHEFSGGQRQRICIARALALNPKVVIADEAVSALDVSIQAQIVNLLLDLQREFGIAFLFISHDMAVVERISHRVAVMYLGQIVEIGPRQAVFDNPQHPYTRKLMAAVPVADPAHAHKRQPLPADEIPSPVRALGDEPVTAPLVQVGAGHFVARHPIAGAF
ncbi:dipeptide ABC transporter ATP-binding protein [Serratia marcescens]|nr:dipeptide ABC transporter ATP-binding protein [Serratia marcescens]